MVRKSKPAAGRAQGELFPSQFERDFLVRTLGDLVRIPETSLSELVANAWDAGASRVDVVIPERPGEPLTVSDDGTGLTREQFEERWMRLAYNRQERQGSEVEFPPGRTGKRRAYGRNGQGRHALLCFGDTYDVTTRRDGKQHQLRVRTASGEDPLEARLIEARDASGHGLRLEVVVQRRLPNADRIRDVLSSRFLHDPSFRIAVNGTSLQLEQLAGLERERVEVELGPERRVVLQIHAVQGDAGRAKRQSGVAFWVGGRLVGEPGWMILGTPILDGRTKAGRQTTVVVVSDDLYDEVRPDWSGFHRSDVMKKVGAAVVDGVERVLQRIYAQRVDDTTREVLGDHLAQIEALDPGEQREVAAVAKAITQRNPLIAEKVLSAAVEGIIEIKRESSMYALMQRISAMPEEDRVGLARLLDEWSVRDALTVLDEIKRRIRVVEALEKLMGDKGADELRVLHPLVAHARWLFGPEYDSPHYSFNLGLRNAIEKVFGVAAETTDFTNSRRRVDLLVRPDGTLTAAASEDFDPQSNLAMIRRVLLVELKKGGFRIGRNEMDQASGYIEDLANSGHLVGAPFIHAFVVGHETDPKTTWSRKIGDRGVIEAWTYSSLVQTANARLFRIRDQVSDRYPESSADLIAHLKANRSEADQMGISFGKTKTA